MYIRDITRRTVIDLLDSIVDRGSPGTANSVYRLLGGLMNWCLDRGILDASPCIQLKPPAVGISRDRILSDDEIRWFWKASEEAGYPFGSLFRLLLLTGQRRDEIAQMRRSEVDLGAALWTLPKERSKNSKAHQIPLSPLALRIFEFTPIIEKSDFVFTTNGRTPVSGWSRTKRRFDAQMLAIGREERGQDAAIPNWRLHDLRRTAASGMARLGQPVHVIEAVLNHKSGSIRGVAAVYNRYTYGLEKQYALREWDVFLRDLTQDNSGVNSDRELLS